MKSLRSISYMLAVSLIIIPMSLPAAASQQGAKDFIKTVSEKAINIIQNSNKKDDVKQKELTKLFEDSVDTAWIGKFAMGRYWTHTTDKQKEQYLELHRQFLINSYVPKFKEYNNQKIVLKKVTEEYSKEYLVESEITQKDAPAIKVNYKVREEAGKYKIYDVIAEGVSLITAQRSEFGSILSRKGVDYLIKQLQAKV